MSAAVIGPRAWDRLAIQNCPHDLVVSLSGEASDSGRIRVARVGLAQALPYGVGAQKIDNGLRGIVGQRVMLNVQLATAFAALVQLRCLLLPRSHECEEIIMPRTSFGVGACVSEVEVPPVEFLVDEIVGKALTAAHVPLLQLRFCEVDVRERVPGMECGLGGIPRTRTRKESIPQLANSSSGASEVEAVWDREV